jgi:hypothetical protein
LEQLRVRCSSNCIAAMARTTALRRSKDDPAAANPAAIAVEASTRSPRMGFDGRGERFTAMNDAPVT